MAVAPTGTGGGKPAAAAQARLRKVVERLEAMAVGAVEAAARAKAAARAQEDGARALEDKLAKVESERAALVAKLESLTESRAVAKVTAREIAGRLDRAVGEVRAALGR